MINPVFEKIKGGLVVSCQAEGDSPFNTPEGVTMFAKAAVQGGAVAIRSQGKDKTNAIISGVNVPVIGLIKSEFDDGYVKITGTYKDVEDLLEIKTDIIAVDGTFRLREGLTGPEFIAEIKKRWDCTIMADIATVEEALACADAGADCISTTLSGYTPETKKLKTDSPDFELVKNLVGRFTQPIFAEGRINNPEWAAEMVSLGVWGVVVGSAITRPHLITEWYVKAINQSRRV